MNEKKMNMYNIFFLKPETIIAVIRHRRKSSIAYAATRRRQKACLVTLTSCPSQMRLPVAAATELAYIELWGRPAALILFRVKSRDMPVTARLAGGLLIAAISIK